MAFWLVASLAWSVCALRVPEELRERFSDVPPIFKNVEVGREDIGPHMKSFCERYGLLRKPRRTLIGSFNGQEVMLGTPLLRWYMEHGLHVHHIFEVIQFKPKACFASFSEKICQMRRQADEDKERYGILGEMYKLIGNW